MDDYGRVQSVSPEVFERNMAELEKKLVDATESNEEDIRRIERLLDLRKGILAGMRFRLQKSNCGHCGRLLTFYDFVYSGLVEAGHSKSFMVHTLLGSKLVINTPRLVKCSSCNTPSAVPKYYLCGQYGCCGDP